MTNRFGEVLRFIALNPTSQFQSKYKVKVYILYVCYAMQINSCHFEVNVKVKVIDLNCR